jgi:murein DD-endopeptidase MepM/ murein hydrolase activator NlpD
VGAGQRVARGDVIGTMGNSGTSGVHLHFNVSTGDYKNDINPFDLLVSTSPTACAAPPPSEPPPAPEPPPGSCGILAANQTLRTNDSVTSCDGRFTLVMQGDNNLVLYKHGATPLWWTATNGGSGAFAAMQGDGNFVVYNSASRPLWYTGTHGNAGAWLAVQDDGNVVIYRAGRALWNSGTAGR